MIEKCNKKYANLVQNGLLIFNSYENFNNSLFKHSFQSFNGGIFKSKFYVDKSINKLITIKNVDDNGFNTDSVSYLDSDKIDQKYLLYVGDILLTMTGNIGRCGIVDEDNCYLNQRVLLLKSKSNLYLFCFLLKYKANIVLLGKGTAQLNLSLEDLNKLKVKNSMCEIKSFNKYDCIFDNLVNIKLQIKKLKQIKQLLLLKYF